MQLKKQLDKDTLAAAVEKVGEQFPELSPEVKTKIAEEYFWWYATGIEYALNDMVPEILLKVINKGVNIEAN